MKPESGDTVRVHYTGTLADGSEFDSSKEREPLEFTVGEGQVIKGFEDAVADLDVGETKKVTVPANDAYGERFDEAVETIPLEAFSGDTPEPGWMVELVAPDGRQMAATVVDVADDKVTLDFNHPLAGEDLTFEIELVDVNKA